jgi:hypothetical protein
MRFASLTRLVAGACAAVLAVGFVPRAVAEQDYEFAKKLMEQDEPSFGTDDLVQRLIVRLEASPATVIDAKLIKATVKRRQAEKASVEKRKDLLDEAEALYKEILAGDAKHRLYAIAEKDGSTIVNDRIKATKKAAKELSATDANKARQMRADAAAQMEKLAAPHKVVAEAAQPEFEKVFKAFGEWRNKNDPNMEGKPIPRDLEDQLGKTFDTWIIADKRYVAAKVEQLECYDDGDPAKKALAEELSKYTQSRIDMEVIGEFPVIMAWYSYMQGRIFAAIADAEKASEAWNTALSVDMANMGDDLRKQMFMLKKFVLHDFVKMKMKAKKYGDVEEVVVGALIDPNLKSFFEEDSGKDLLVDYAKALTLPVTDASGAPEYEKAIKKLREMVEKETRGGANTMWANQFSRTMAEVLEDARNKNVRPRLTSDEWYNAARGFFLMGQQEHLKLQEMKRDNPDKVKEHKEQFEKAYEEFQNAVDYYRRAIAAARSDKTDLATRIEIEPKAWFEMGLSYVKMEHYYEAIVVNQAMRTTFMADNRKKWLPDPSNPLNKKVYTKTLMELISDLDKPKDGLVAKAGSNVMFALERNASSRTDLWNKRLKQLVLDTSPDIVGDSAVTDRDYISAKNDAEFAKGLVEAVKNLADVKIVEENYGQASLKYVAAAERFLKVPTSSQAYELALYQAGSNFTTAQSLWFTYRFPSKKPKEQEEMSAQLSKKALDAFDKYLDYVAKNPAKDDEKGKEDKERREKLEGAILLARVTLNVGLAVASTPETAHDNWSNVIKSADAYLAWPQPASMPNKVQIDSTLLNKFRAQIELTGINFAPKCDPYLHGAEATMNELRKMKPNDNKLYSFMLQSLSRRYNIAAFQAEKFIKEGKMEAGSEEPYEVKVADLQAIRVEMIEEAKDQEPTLEDYSRLVYLFNKTGKHKKAADQAKKLLDTFDPEKKNVKIADDEKIWQGILARMIGDRETATMGVIKYNDLAKEDRCKKDHAVLIDYMYDTRQGLAAAETPEKRPSYDKYNMDMDKALKQLETIVKNYPDCQTRKVGEKAADGSEKPFLTMIEEEIDFRRKIEAARDLLFKLAQEVADAETKAGNEEGAKNYRQMAYDQVEILQKIRGETPQMQIMMADIAVLNGKFEDALNSLYAVRNQQERGTPLYFDASKKISETYARMKKWEEASEYPKFLAVTAGFKSKLVKDKWPAMEQFLENCYANGATKPAPGTAPEEKKEETKKDEKKDEPKKEEPKAEETKAPDANAEAKKE